MRAHEFIKEGKIGKLPRELAHAATTMVKFRDDGFDRAYSLNRAMMAAAIHDGKTDKAVEMPASSFVDRFNTAHPYTREESNMVKGAIKTVGGQHKDIIKDPRSTELPEINKASPVAGFAGYPRKRK